MVYEVTERCTRLYKATEGYRKLCKESEGYTRVYEATEGYSRLYEATEGYIRVYEATIIIIGISYLYRLNLFSNNQSIKDLFIQVKLVHQHQSIVLLSIRECLKHI